MSLIVGGVRDEVTQEAPDQDLELRVKSEAGAMLLVVK